MRSRSVVSADGVLGFVAGSLTAAVVILVVLAWLFWRIR